MSQQYLLPCSCGQATLVSAAQAGRILVCPCGRDLKVPTLAKLQNLEPASAAIDKDHSYSAATWNPLRGGLFVGGVLLAVVGLVIGGYGSFVLRQIDVAAYSQHFKDIELADLGDIERMSPEETLTLWDAVKDIGPGDAGSATPLRVREVYDGWMTFTVAGFIAAGVGLLASTGSMIGAARPK